MEGAEGWESFSLITFPMMSPIILTNAVYTIIDTFLTTTNEVVMLVRDEAIMGAGYGVSMAMAVLYFVMILIILGITIKVSSRWVFYQE